MKYWERLCTHCGLCCHEKVVLDDILIVDPDRKCEFYDDEKHLCSVYNERFNKCSRCRKVTIAMAMFSSSLPSVCGYAREMKRLHLRFARKKEFVLSNLD